MAEKSLPATGKRVRTGCLTCRVRRRKCGEEKPICQNCEIKDLNCNYGLNITFVEPKRNGRRSHPRSRLRKYANVNRVAGNEANQDSGPQNERDTDNTTNTDTVARTCEEQLKTHSTKQIESETKRDGDEADTTNHSKDTDTTTPNIHLENLNQTSTLANSSAYQPYTSDQRAISQCSTSRSANIQSEEEEVNLLIYYRYRIAPTIDQGVGDVYFGIRALNRSTESPEVYNSIVSLSHAHQEATARLPPEAPYDISTSSPRLFAEANPFYGDKITSICLRLWKNMLLSPPHMWQSEINSTNYSSVHVPDEFFNHSIMLSQLSLAAALTSSESITVSKFSVPKNRNDLEGDSHSLVHSLYHSLQLLERSLSLSQPTGHNLSKQATPFATLWQSCWEDIQSWYACRAEDAQEITQIAEQDLIYPSDNQTAEAPFPLIIFTSTCAATSNIIHHLSATLLLLRKPRLIKPRSSLSSSLSTSWHIQKVLGIAASTEEQEIWTPIVVACVIQASQRLSHGRQLTEAIRLLERASTYTCIPLSREIQKIESLRAMAAQ